MRPQLPMLTTSDTAPMVQKLVRLATAPKNGANEMDRMICMQSFVKVVECSGFSAAARRLDITTSAVTGHVKSLEEKLGVRLLTRNTRSVRVTEVGQTYYERCAKILTELDDVEQIVADTRSEPRGVLKLNIAPPIREIIAPVIAEFTATYPDLSIQVTVTSQMVDLIDQGVDLALHVTPSSHSSYIVRRLATYPLVVCGAPRYFATHGQPERPADLNRHNCIVFSEFQRNREWRFVGPCGADGIRVSGNFQADDSASLRAAAVLGQGLIYVPNFVVAEELQSGRLIATLTDLTPIELSLDAIYPDRRHLSAKVRCFIDMAAKRLVHANWNCPERRSCLKPERSRLFSTKTIGFGVGQSREDKRIRHAHSSSAA